MAPDVLASYGATSKGTKGNLTLRDRSGVTILTMKVNCKDYDDAMHIHGIAMGTTSERLAKIWHDEVFDQPLGRPLSKKDWRPKGFEKKLPLYNDESEIQTIIRTTKKFKNKNK